MGRAPVRIVAVVTGVCALALAALGAALTIAPVLPGQRGWLLLVLLGAMTGAARLAPLPLGQHQKLVVSTAPLFAALLLEPVAPVMVMAAVAVLIGERRLRQPGLQAAFNAAVELLQVAAGAAAFHIVAAGPFATLSPGRLLAAVSLAALAMVTVSAGLVELVVAVQQRRLSAGEVWRRRRRDLASEASLYALGLLVAVAATVYPWTAALLAVPALIVYRSLRASLVLQEQLAHQAFHDPLTDLPNRARFTDDLTQAIGRAARTGGGVAVLYLDLDGFKQINDTLGHSVGDGLLRLTAQRLRDGMKRGTIVARFGGDEFTVLLPNGDHAIAAQTAEQMLAAIRRPAIVEDQQFTLDGSIGIVLSAGGHAGAEELLRDADIAMYRAKAEGKGRWAVFAEEMYDAVRERVRLEHELRRAVDGGELRVHYQPTVALDTGRTVGAEALVRWQHPERGLIPPGQFITLAEETGLIVPIGRLVLREACHQARQWQATGRSGSPFRINVNLSARQVQDPQLAADVAAALVESGIAPDSLVLEVTESAVMEDADAALATLQGLKALGIRLALDDFGTGYSSLSYLHRFPFDILKIDKSFVDGLEVESRESALVSTIIRMGQSLHLQTVGEGIESAEQAAALQRLGCDYGQGYYFARPLAASALSERLHQERTSLTAGPPVLRQAS